MKKNLIYYPKKTKNDSKCQIKLGKNFLSWPIFVLLGNIETQNNHHQTPLIKWNSLTPCLIFFMVLNSVNHDFFFFILSKSSNSLFLLSNTWNENKKNKILYRKRIEKIYRDKKCNTEKVEGPMLTFSQTFKPLSIFILVLYLLILFSLNNFT